MADLSAESLRAELLRPHEIRAALARVNVVYLPLGTIEYHSEHLPIGLDALNAHSVCLMAADKFGGIVWPPLYYGTGGGHSDYPWTVMIDDAELIRALIIKTLQRLNDMEVEIAVIFTGHFADEQLALIANIESTWNSEGHSLTVLSLAVNMPLAEAPEPDHAGVFETTLFSATWPERIDLTQLPSVAKAPSVDPGGDAMGLHRHDPGHPLWGIFGPDPRMFDASRGPALLEKLAEEVVARVMALEPQTPRPSAT